MRQVNRLILGVLLPAALCMADEFTTAVEQVKPALVSIVIEKLARAPAADSSGSGMTPARGIGSGFVIDTLGHILTCNHVVAGYDDITVKLSDGALYSGRDVKLVGRDPSTDLAVLRVNVRRRFTPAKLGNSDELRVGQWIMALGSPFGLEGTATAGVVSALSRWGLAKSSGPDFQAFIQTDALINPGNSGGPLIDAQGHVIGISSFGKTEKSGLTGIGFATPINLARAVAKQLIEKGTVIRGFLGISTQAVTEDIRQALGLQSRAGALVASVGYNQPGMKAGIMPGDVIVELDGTKVDDVRWFQNEVAARKPGSAITLTYLRKGQRKTATATLAAWPVVGTEPREKPVFKSWLGLVLADVPDKDRQRYGLEYGLVVSTVERGSPADDVGIHATDIVLEMNLTPLKSVDDYESARQTVTASGKPVLLRVLRGRQAFYAAISQ